MAKKTSASEIRPADGGAKIVLVGMGVSVALMLVAILMFRLTGPGLVKHVGAPQPSQQRAPAMESQDVPEGMQAMMGMVNKGQNGMAGQEENAIVSSMQRLQANPNDVEALLDLADRFMEQENYGTAQGFINRATVAAPSDPRPSYYQGVLHAREGRYTEAAEAMERSLQLMDSPATRYSLAVIYIYHLGDKDKGLTMLRLALESPDVQGDLRSMIMDELDKQAEAE